MNNDLISREALMDIAQQQGHVTVDDILNTPAVRPEVRRGKWERKRDLILGKNYYECSECKEWANGRGKFCPNCGADMREVEP